MAKTLLAGKWSIEHELGGGGMGRVVKARYASSNYPCAIKFLHVEHKHNEELVARFLNEAQLSNQVGHPGVCRVIDVGWTDTELPFLVMEYLEGDSLEQVLTEAGGLLAIGEALRIATRVLEILIEAHERGVLHRDIKPDNVFITREGAIKVLDFGVAKMPGVDITRVGAALGTVGYMSPEAALGASRSAGPKADVWSVGVTLFRMLTGELPVKLPARANHLEILRAAATTPARKLSELLPRCPVRLDQALAQMLAFEPEQRCTARRAHEQLAAVVIASDIATHTAPWVWDPSAAAQPRSAKLERFVSEVAAENSAELSMNSASSSMLASRTTGEETRIGRAPHHFGSDEGDVEELHDRLHAEPTNYAIHHALVDAYVEAGELDHARTIAKTLRFVGEASEREQELAEQLDGVFHPPVGRISRRQWREALMVSHPSAQLSALLARLWPVLAASRRRAYDDMNIDEAGRQQVRLDADGLPRWIAYLSTVLDMPAPELIVVDDRGKDFELVVPTVDQLPVPTLLAGPDAVAPQPAPARAFRCGHALAWVHPYLIAGSILPSSTRLRDAIHGATALTWPNVIIPATHANKAEVWRTIIESLLLPDRIEALRKTVERVVQMGGDTKGWLRGCQHTAARVGLLVSGDLDLAAAVIRGGGVALSIDGEAVIEDLVSFSVSLSYLELRRTLGMG